MTATASRPRGRTGLRVELARYVVSAGERVLFGQRVDGVVRVTDVPAHADGRAYLRQNAFPTERSRAAVTHFDRSHERRSWRLLLRRDHTRERDKKK